MTRTNEPLDHLLDQALEDLRAESMPEAQAQAASDRVLQTVLQAARQERAREEIPVDQAQAAIEGCEDFQALIPALVAEELVGSRRLLLEDHLRSCIPCRRALMEARKAVAPPMAQPQQLLGDAPKKSGSPWLRWAAVAVLAVGLGAVTWTLLDLVPMSWGQVAKIQELDGELYQVTREGYIPLTPGQEIPYGETVRTAKRAGAIVRLEDGTRIELDSRAEMELKRRRKGTIIDLGRGNIIVEAAPQRDGKLFVATEDCLVSVTGTIFSVKSGVKGSRVSVVEGEVEVDYGARKAVLAPGQQVSTHPSVGPVPVAREISWSRNVDAYLDLLEELHALRQDMGRAISNHGLRYSTELLDLMPPTTAVYASLPNLSEGIGEAYELLQERVASSPALNSWWEEEVGSSSGQPILQTALGKIRQLGDNLGPEVSVGVTMEGDDLLILAKVMDATALRSFLEAELAAAEDGPDVVILSDPRQSLPAGAADADLLIWVGGELLAISSELTTLQQLATVLDGAANPFATSPFRQILAEVYGDGADWLVGADMKAVLAQAREGEEGEEQSQILEASGILDVEYLVLERKAGTGSMTHHRAVLSFDGPRRGIASWLAAPAPMASLDFVSPDAYFATTVLAKEPEQLVEDLFGLLDTVSPKLRENVESFQQEHEVRIIEDFAAPLGGEMTIAIDGPVLPTLSWMVILEVYDSARLQNTIRWLVDKANEQGASGDLIRLEQGDFEGRPIFTLGSAGGEIDLQYTFVDGYLLAAPTRALIERAVQFRDSGYSLSQSPRFTALLPADGHANFSALSYQNLGTLLGPLAEHWPGSGQKLTGPQQEKLRDVVSRTPATLACAYGEAERIIFVGNSEDSFLSGLLGLSGALSLEGITKRIKGLPISIRSDSEPTA